MNLSETKKLLQELIAIPSLPGEEKSALDFLVSYFRKFNWQIEIIPNPKTDQNYLILVSFGRPEIIFTTHVDVVPAKPEQFQPIIVNDKIYGRGSNDAKGILVSMIAACRALELCGETNFGLLVVFEEEASSDGSRLAGEVLANRGIKYLINGEPTEGKLATGHKGILSFKLVCKGKNAHSGYPEIGQDANRQIISLAEKLYQLDYGFDSQLGFGTINIGVIQGGTAANVVADHAEIDVLVRVVTSAEEVKKQILEVVGTTVEIIFQNTEDPIKLNLLPGFETIVAAYFTDLPNLLKMGAVGYLYGPGNILRAHTDEEYICTSEIAQAILGYQQIFQQLKNDS